MSTQTQWERLAEEAIADAADWKAQARTWRDTAMNVSLQRDELLAALREAEALIPELVRQLPNGAPMSVAAAHDRIRAAIAKSEGK